MIFYIRLFVLIGFVAAWVYRKYFTRKYNFPPGPKPWPIIGNYPNLFSNFVELFEDWRKKYGDVVMFTRLGTRFVYISDYEIGYRAFAVDNPVELAGRPQNGVDRLSVGDMEVFFTRSMSPEFQDIRKLIMTTLRKVAEPKKMMDISNTAFDLFKSHVLEKKELIDADGFDVEPLCYWIGHNLLVKCFWGDAVEFAHEDYQETIRLISNVQEAVGNLQYFDLLPKLMMKLPYPPTKRALALSIQLSNFIKLKMDKRRESEDFINDPKWFIDYAMKIQDEQMEPSVKSKYPNLPKFDDFFVANLAIDNYLAGMDAYGIGFTWIIGLLATHPHVVDNIRRELASMEEKTGQPFNLKWIDDLHYINGVINETYRFNSLSTLTSFHRAIDDVKIGSYDVPKDTIVALNIYAYHFNPKYWPDPYEFKPERFLNAEGKFQKPKEGFMPFGIGRRICVAERYVVKESHFVFVARLCLEFNIHWTARNESKKLIQRLDKVLFRRCEPFYVTLEKR